ncbi:glycoside hydrolase family 2 protein [Halocatena pleomorpha]|uniref:Beta-galactosidase n=1 Tax=Halocatena pleomorpha TaxID=1785090 RepID=A0A3P3RMF6_9EURY|nr:glycoside hydrolase family 2 TIM barrel-domain containing protein [Halocatena pleomorpha]RRJ34060.1 beta-galactosidase [Halocatena pleomorpha]
MHRTFEPTPSRRRQYLDGRWQFVTDPEDEGREEEYWESFPATDERMTVPCGWNARPDYVDYEGPAWYRTTFELLKRRNVRLTFLAVAHDASVYLDGEHLVGHYGGHTQFEAVCQGLAAGEHELVVRVDNERDEISLPRPGADWLSYGGITREVFVEELPDVFVDDLNLSYKLDGDCATVDAEVALRNLGDDAEREVTLTIDGTETTDVVELVASEPIVDRSVALSVEFGGVEQWSREEPRLYTATVTVGDDEYRDRIGFRTLSVDGTDILLNGSPVELAGVNRHEDHPEWGHAQPLRLMTHDLDLIQRAGFDTVRASHYPNHPRFLDLCDEEGIFVIEEIPYWQFDAERFARDPVLDRGLDMLEEMVTEHRHHPSVFAWSIHNECATQEEGLREPTERLVDRTRELDDSRLVTYASNRDFEGYTDECVDLVDFIGINAYWDWYFDGKTWPEFLEDVRNQYGETPAIVSEFGAGAVPGERTVEAQKWSEPFQREYLQNAVETFRESEFVSGFTVWQYCDIRVPRRKAMHRPRTQNNKGIVDEYRRPKEAYWTLRDVLPE